MNSQMEVAWMWLKAAQKVRNQVGAHVILMGIAHETMGNKRQAENYRRDYRTIVEACKARGY